MSVDKIRAQIVANIWQAIAQSQVDLSIINQAEQEALVNKIADNMLVAFDAIIGTEMENNTETPALGTDEKILWKGRPFLSVVESYIITTERIKLVSGLIARKVENYELIRIQDIDFKQNMGERLMGMGDITIRGQDPSDSEIVLRNIPDPEKIYELLRKAWLEARSRYGLQFREYM
ncbi:MAG: PH domain-containing protein [Chloroflexi bacterium]|jgi:hypothetical protein|nr:PH domain-containing protein [Chloroflexota bacterium]